MKDSLSQLESLESVQYKKSMLQRYLNDSVDVLNTTGEEEKTSTKVGKLAFFQSVLKDKVR